MAINYKKKVWTNETKLTAEALNNIENGLNAVCGIVDQIGDWAKQQTKPKYTPQEVGAEPRGEVEKHDIQGTAHAYLFSQVSKGADYSALFDELSEVKKSITTLKSSVTKLTNRVKELEDKNIEE